MGSLIEILKNPDDLLPLVKLKMAAMRAKKKIPMEPHWCFCYSTLHRVSRSFALLIHQLGSELRDVVCIYYLVLRALDTIEDDTSIALEVKLPILLEFHRRIYDRDWHFSCGTEAEKVLMDQFHNVSTAFLELERGYQEVIEDIAKRMGAGMAKFIAKDETETIEDYDEYCHYAAGLVGIGLSKFFHISGSENLAHDFLSNQMGLFLQKSSVLRDYLEDINEMPKPRKIWPRQVWSKYATELKDFKYGENSVKALQCLNEMVSISLSHVEDCFKYMSDLKDPAIFHLCAIPQILSIAMLTLCYNNIQVFRGGVKLNLGLTAKVFDRTRTMSDVYGAFFDFASILKSKVEMSDPSALITLSRLETIQKICRDSGTLSKRRKSYIIKSEPRYSSIMMAVLVITLAIAFVYLFANQSGSQMTFMRMMSITDY